MPCIAGTRSQPRIWWLYKHGMEREVHGRECDWNEDRTSRRNCSFCPAFRGRRYDTTIATGIAPNGDPQGLTDAEHTAYLAAQEAAFEEDDFAAIGRWEEQMLGAAGMDARRRWGEIEAAEWWAAYMRDYRKRRAEAGTTPKRKRTEYMREYMKKRRALAVGVPGTSSTASLDENQIVSRPPPRARDRTPTANKGGHQ